jgi:hypothetical protein
MRDKVSCGTQQFLLSYYIRNERPFSPSVAGSIRPVFPITEGSTALPISALPHAFLIVTQVDFLLLSQQNSAADKGCTDSSLFAGKGSGWS